MKCGEGVWVVEWVGDVGYYVWMNFEIVLILFDVYVVVEIFYEGCWFSLCWCGCWEYVECNNFGGVVIILVVMFEDCILFVEQYCVFIFQCIIEMLVGLVGDIVG